MPEKNLRFLSAFSLIASLLLTSGDLMAETAPTWDSLCGVLSTGKTKGVFSKSSGSMPRSDAARRRPSVDPRRSALRISIPC